METTRVIWMNGALVPWAQATVHVLTHGLHYGSGVFEGIRCYDTPKGPAIFRLGDHLDRLQYSAAALRMELPYSSEQLRNACTSLVRENELRECYIRPIAFYGYGKMGLNPVGAPVDVTIACWPWGAYLGGDTIKVKTSQYMRIHPRTSVTDAKICGHYVNSIMASLEVHGDDRYDEALFLDDEGNVAEGPGENVFLVKDGEIITPRLNGILAGITRDSVMVMARDFGLTVTERTVRPSDLIAADEAFFTGTAAEITGIVSLDDRPVGTGLIGPVTRRLREAYDAAIHGREKQYEQWLTYL